MPCRGIWLHVAHAPLHRQPVTQRVICAVLIMCISKEKWWERPIADAMFSLIASDCGTSRSCSFLATIAVTNWRGCRTGYDLMASTRCIGMGVLYLIRGILYIFFHLAQFWTQISCMSTAVYLALLTHASYRSPLWTGIFSQSGFLHVEMVRVLWDISWDGSYSVSPWSNPTYDPNPMRVYSSYFAAHAQIHQAESYLRAPVYLTYLPHSLEAIGRALWMIVSCTI